MHEKIEHGMKLGKLIVISETEPSRGTSRWNCKCDCGNDVILTDAILRRGIINNCGCSSKFTDLSGQKYGLLTVLERVPIVHPIGRQTKMEMPMRLWEGNGCRGYLSQTVASCSYGHKKSAPDINKRPIILITKIIPVPKSGCNIISRK